jgi:signal transduction histidine kinase
MSPVDLADLVRGIGELYEPVAEDRGLGFAVEVSDDPAQVLGNRQLLSRSLANLVENALKYTPAGGRIRIESRTIDSRVEVIVSDSGPGIPASMRERVFDRFFRLESSRTSEGNGLGLSLARAIVRLHGGTIILGDAADMAPSGGLRVLVSLPRLPMPGDGSIAASNGAPSVRA